MAKLENVKQELFAGEAVEGDIAVFGSTKTGIGIPTKDIAEIQSQEYKEGFASAIIDDKAPFMEDVNAALYTSSYQIAASQQEGIWQWLQDKEYCKGSIVKVLDESGEEVGVKLYKSLVDNNIGNQVTDNQYWKEIEFGGVGSDLTKFSINNGKITNGIEDILINNSNQLAFNVDENNPITYTNANGETFTKNALSPIDVSDKADGTYNVMLNSTNQPYLHSGNIYYQKGEPTSMNEGDIWLNKNTQKAYKYTDDELVEFADVPIEKAITISSGIITKVEQPRFNELRYKYSDMPSNKYIDLTLGASGSTYTAPADGYFTADDSLQSGLQLFIDKNPTYAMGQMAITGDGGGPLVTLQVKKGDIATLRYWGDVSTLRFGFVYAESEV